uniref:Uncharacterized protein n=1 Tax=Arundo donax TaxID=35708 RepID=A0A0A8YFU9_ARUDO
MILLIDQDIFASQVGWESKDRPDYNY